MEGEERSNTRRQRKSNRKNQKVGIETGAIEQRKGRKIKEGEWPLQRCMQRMDQRDKGGRMGRK